MYIFVFIYFLLLPTYTYTIDCISYVYVYTCFPQQIYTHTNTQSVFICGEARRPASARRAASARRRDSGPLGALPAPGGACGLP